MNYTDENGDLRESHQKLHKKYKKIKKVKNWNCQKVVYWLDKKGVSNSVMGARNASNIGILGDGGYQWSKS